MNTSGVNSYISEFGENIFSSDGNTLFCKYAYLFSRQNSKINFLRSSWNKLTFIHSNNVFLANTITTLGGKNVLLADSFKLIEIALILTKKCVDVFKKYNSFYIIKIAKVLSSDVPTLKRIPRRFGKQRFVAL